jgi:hypothetical protein
MDQNMKKKNHVPRALEVDPPAQAERLNIFCLLFGKRVVF